MLANEIWSQRTRIRLSQKALASRLQVHENTINNWETSSSFPNSKFLVCLAKVFGCTPNDLLKEEMKDV
jgi:transcriptional regulator with XRE-family HTH domain